MWEMAELDQLELPQQQPQQQVTMEQPGAHTTLEWGCQVSSGRQHSHLIGQLTQIEQMRKQFRCHRDMSRLVIAFIEKVWRESIGIKNTEIKEEIEKIEDDEQYGTELDYKDEDLMFMMEF